MENQEIKIKARAVKENKAMTSEEISVCLEQIKDNSIQLESISKKANELEKKLQTDF